MQTAVLGLGGNALIQYGEKGTVEQELSHLNKALKNILPLFKKYNVVITHGNGPQVGNLLLMEKFSERNNISGSKMPLYVQVARTQGEIGILIQEKLHNLLLNEKIKLPVVNILTRVIVDPNDPAFENPSKPVGPFYSEKEFEKIRTKKNFVKTKKGYRMVVPSPEPLEIVELEQIKTLSRKAVVICCGGGGIPVVKNSLAGTNAVIDKDFASQKLASDLKASLFVILTDVDFVYLNFREKNQKEIREISLSKIKKYYKKEIFPNGSMGPKIKAAINFLESGGEKVIIASPNNIKKAIKGMSGTIISND